jgi:type IV pilus assembly protein PilX
MMTRPHRPRRSPLPRRAGQRGVVLLFSLIALVIMLIAAVALVRSFNTSLFSAGNIGFKRDMRNQSEMAVSTALSYFRTGGFLNTAANRANTPVAGSNTVNYSATMLPTNAQGIPNVLALSDGAFAAAYNAPDLQSPDASGSVKVRYVIDRLCATTGDEKTLGSGSCVLADNPVPDGTSEENQQGADRGSLGPGKKSPAPQGVVYRLSVKVTGPRSTQSFFQSTFTVPS